VKDLYALLQSVTVGGRFRQLAINEKLLLTATAVVADPETDDIISPSRRRIIIGITAGGSWNERQGKVADFFESTLAFPIHVKTSRTVEDIDKTGQKRPFYPA
jgi:hypothetical protein